MDNNRMEQISLLQFSILVFIFITGSAVVVGIGADAKQDAWIAIIIATIIGILIFQFYLYLMKRSNEQNFFTLLEKCFGKWLGKSVIVIYIFYFYYIASRVLRDFGELLVTTIYSNTPIEVVDILLMLIIAYILGKGIEILARTAEIFIPYLIFFIAFVGVGIVVSGEFHPSFLEPILGDGLKPVAKAVFPSLIGFPFGELIVFTMLFQGITLKKKVNKASIWTIAVGGMTIVYATVIQIGVLGTGIRERASFPLLTAAREISLLNFIERVDLVIVFTVMLGIVVKVSIFFYGGLKGIEHLTKIPYRRFVLPHALLIAVISILISQHYAEHLLEGLKIVPLYLHMPLQYGIPFVLFPILMWKQRQYKQ
jgi:spore germination protein KB